MNDFYEFSWTFLCKLVFCEETGDFYGQFYVSWFFRGKSRIFMYFLCKLAFI